MRIIPNRGLSINGVHVERNVPVEVEDKIASELVAIGVAVRAPNVEAPVIVIETAEAAPAPETATLKRPRRSRF